MSFFNDDKVVTEDLISEHVFLEFPDSFYRTYGIHYQISPNGGPILLTRDFKDTESILPIDETLKQKIVVHCSNGTEITRITAPQNIIACFFLKNENILILKRNGQYHIYNPYNYNLEKNVIVSEIPLKNYFINQQGGEGIRLCINDGNSMILLANNSLHFIYNLENPKRVQLLGNNKDYIFDKFTEKSIAYFSRAGGSEYHFYIACLKSGIMKITFNEKVTSVTKIFGHINSRITKISISPSKKIIALVTEDWDIFVFKINDFNSQFRIDLQMSEKDIQRFRTIEWIKDHTICICFTRYIKFVTRTQTIPFEKSFISGINSGEYQLLYGSEIDGLRVIAIDRQGGAKNILIRKIAKAHENVKGMLSFSPGAILYIIYKNYKNNKPPKEEDIIDDPVKLPGACHPG